MEQHDPWVLKLADCGLGVTVTQLNRKMSLSIESQKELICNYPYILIHIYVNLNYMYCEVQ